MRQVFSIQHYLYCQPVSPFPRARRPTSATEHDPDESHPISLQIRLLQDRTKTTALRRFSPLHPPATHKPTSHPYVHHLLHLHDELHATALLRKPTSCGSKVSILSLPGLGILDPTQCLPSASQPVPSHSGAVVPENELRQHRHRPASMTPVLILHRIRLLQPHSSSITRLHLLTAPNIVWLHVRLFFPSRRLFFSFRWHLHRC
jgi:hypothetical protein